jgi:hypothetical protein
MSAVVICENNLVVEIGTPVSLVWGSFCFEIANWWPKTMMATPDGEMVLEPVLGGKLFEDSGNGHGVHWFSVVALEEEALIEFVGVLTPMFGGPAQVFLTLKFEQEGENTHLKIADQSVGRERDSGAVLAGWAEVFDALKHYCESGEGQLP